jgi:hypothetical protein
MPRKKIPKNKKYNKKVAAEICSYIEKNMTLDEIHAKDPEKYPARTTVYTWTKEHPEFDEMYMNARRIQVNGYLEDYNNMLNNPPEFTGDKFLDSHNRFIWDKKCRSMEFKLNRIAKIFDKKTFGDEQVVEHKGLENLGPQIVIANYAVEEKKEKVVSNIIEHKGGKK